MFDAVDATAGVGVVDSAAGLGVVDLDVLAAHVPHITRQVSRTNFPINWSAHLPAYSALHCTGSPLPLHDAAAVAVVLEAGIVWRWLESPAQGPR